MRYIIIDKRKAPKNMTIGEIESGFDKLKTRALRKNKKSRWK